MRVGRRLAVVIVVAAVVVALAVFFGYRARHAHDDDPVTVDAACPALLPGTTNAVQDFADVLYFGGRQLVGTESAPTLGPQVGVVSCSIAEMVNPNGWRVSGGPWPDGTAVALPRGTPLFAARDRPAGAVVARTDDGDVLYCPADESLSAVC